jgi:hypothetical protein
MRHKQSTVTQTGAAVAATMMKARNKGLKRPYKRRDLILAAGCLTPIPVGGSNTPEQIKQRY